MFIFALFLMFISVAAEGVCPRNCWEVYYHNDDYSVYEFIDSDCPKNIPKTSCGKGDCKEYTVTG